MRSRRGHRWLGGTRQRAVSKDDGSSKGGRVVGASWSHAVAIDEKTAPSAAARLEVGRGAFDDGLKATRATARFLGRQARRWVVCDASAFASSELLPSHTCTFASTS